MKKIQQFILKNFFKDYSLLERMTNIYFTNINYIAVKRNGCVHRIFAFRRNKLFLIINPHFDFGQIRNYNVGYVFLGVYDDMMDLIGINNHDDDQFYKGLLIFERVISEKIYKDLNKDYLPKNDTPSCKRGIKSKKPFEINVPEMFPVTYITHTSVSPTNITEDSLLSYVMNNNDGYTVDQVKI